jgi:lipopolysaccharide export system protein LptC
VVALGELLSAYLPLVLMGLLALATWWLVKNTPRIADPGQAVPARTSPTTRWMGSRCERFDRRRQAARAGARRADAPLPDTDTIEIDGVTIRAWGEGGPSDVATARRAVANGDATEVQLQGRRAWSTAPGERRGRRPDRVRAASSCTRFSTPSV